uniref:F-box domain-containing protein n=1 Tax=Steinernema glaseri TaxID=37863 RepID=A0A1I7YGT4_9BILA
MAVVMVVVVIMLMIVVVVVVMEVVMVVFKRRVIHRPSNYSTTEGFRTRWESPKTTENDAEPSALWTSAEIRSPAGDGAVGRAYQIPAATDRLAWLRCLITAICGGAIESLGQILTADGRKGSAKTEFPMQILCKTKAIGGGKQRNQGRPTQNFHIYATILMSISMTEPSKKRSRPSIQEAMEEAVPKDLSYLSHDIIYDILREVPASRIKALSNLAQIEGPWSDECCNKEFISMNDGIYLSRRYFNSEKDLSKIILYEKDKQREKYHIEDSLISTFRKEDPFTLCAQLLPNICGRLFIELMRIISFPEGFLSKIQTRISKLELDNYEKLPESLVSFIVRQLKSPYLREFKASGSLCVKELLDEPLKHFVKSPQFVLLRIPDEIEAPLFIEFYETWKRRTFFTANQHIHLRTSSDGCTELIKYFQATREEKAYEFAIDTFRKSFKHPLHDEATLVFAL